MRSIILAIKEEVHLRKVKIQVNKQVNFRG